MLEFKRVKLGGLEEEGQPQNRKLLDFFKTITECTILCGKDC